MTGTNDHLPKKPERHPSYCSFCFMPNEWQLKFNSGDPRWFAFPTCECAVERTERMLEQRFKNRNNNDTDS